MVLVERTLRILSELPTGAGVLIELVLTGKFTVVRNIQEIP